MVVSALQSSFAKSETDIVLQGMLAIMGLTAGDAANATQLGELGACSGEYMLGSAAI